MDKAIPVGDVPTKEEQVEQPITLMCEGYTKGEQPILLMCAVQTDVPVVAIDGDIQRMLDEFSQMCLIRAQFQCKVSNREAVLYQIHRGETAIIHFLTPGVGKTSVTLLSRNCLLYTSPSPRD